MEAKIGSLTFVDWANQPEDLRAAASIIAQETSDLHGYLNQAAMSSRDIIIHMVVLGKLIMGDPALIKQCVDLAKARKVTLPKDFDLLSSDGNANHWLASCRLFVGEYDEKGVWVPSVYAAKNFPGAMRQLSTYEESDVAGLTSVLENMSAKVGKSKVVRGVEAAKALDREKHGKRRKVASSSQVYIPRALDKVKPVATFRADPSLFPVDEDGFGVGTIRSLGGDKFGVYFGSDEDTDIATIVTAGYECHKQNLAPAKSGRAVPIEQVASLAGKPTEANV